MTAAYQILLDHISVRTLPAYFSEATSRIEAEREHLHALIQKGERIYAVNSLTGHKDDVALTEDAMKQFQTELIYNHQLPAEDFFDDFTSRCVAYLKAHQFANGFTGISPELFALLLAALADENFAPSIPRNASYSSGDVIPGAYLAADLLAYAATAKQEFSLQPKDGISLINGNFVHLGTALALVPRLRTDWLFGFAGAVGNAQLCKANDTNYTSPFSSEAADPIFSISAQFGRQGRRPVQDPVSLRCVPQNLAAQFASLQQWFGSLENELARYSDNPLIVPGVGHAVSQGSFAAPELSLATSRLIDTLLLSGWQICERTKRLLGGKVDGVPDDAADDDNPLGLIQVPKLMQAILESMRMQLNGRVFASGASTSEGIEDYWSYGTLLVQQLTTGLDLHQRLLRLECTAHLYVANRFGGKELLPMAFIEVNDGASFREVYEEVSRLSPETISRHQLQTWRFPVPETV